MQANVCADFPDHTTDSATIAHIDHEQFQVLDSLQQLHQKLDAMAKHLGITAPGHKAPSSLIGAHRGSVPATSPDTEHHLKMDTLISQARHVPNIVHVGTVQGHLSLHATCALV